MAEFYARGKMSMLKRYKADKYDENFLNQNMMGPNSMGILEELLENIELNRDMRVLDLGCGKALSSIFLAKEFGVQVFAIDLWINATDNYTRLQQLHVEDFVIPLHADAHQLPFADEYFDAVISIDAYQYFGYEDEFYDKHLRPILKKDAWVAISIPGMKYDLHKNIPDEMKPFWPEEALKTWHSVNWWKEKFENKLSELEIKEMTCFDRAWGDWLSTENPYAIEDRKMMAADKGRYMNLISITGKSI
jgi:cyclopropane fatty-acyl-phospholipid synthase-like methyltransferase